MVACAVLAGLVMDIHAMTLMSVLLVLTAVLLLEQTALIRMEVTHVRDVTRVMLGTGSLVLMLTNVCEKAMLALLMELLVQTLRAAMCWGRQHGLS